MKRFIAFALIPFALIALEKVNLIKDAGFEKNNGIWLARSKTDPPSGPDSTLYDVQEQDSVKIGKYCCSIDGRKRPAQNLVPLYSILGSFYQVISTKKLGDLDSLSFSHEIIFATKGVPTSAWDYAVILKLYDPTAARDITVWYIWSPPGSGTSADSPTEKFIGDTIKSEGLWLESSRSLQTDLISGKGLQFNVEMDTLILTEGSANFNGVWYSQKVFFDAIRLTGYADYDVGVKGIISKDSVWKDTTYTPTARIKNFGRKPADSFLVIATIEGGAGVVYADTLSWSLTADTEDTVSFKEFEPSDASNYTVTVSTVMTPDESDEDDAMSKTLYGSSVEEQPIPQVLNLDVLSLQAGEGVLRISYTLPLGQQGTISLYDPAGRRIESVRVQGEGSVSLRPGLASGVYFVKLETSKISVTKKAVILK